METSRKISSGARFRALTLALAAALGIGLSLPASADPTGDAPTPPGYPVSQRPPRDAVNRDLVKTLRKEATSIVACRLRGLSDLFPDRRDPDTFYDATCEVTETFRGPLRKGESHFVWQVERGNLMPPPGSELLVFLKHRTKPLYSAPSLEWIALDTGVLRYVPKLREHMHRKAPHK